MAAVAPCAFAVSEKATTPAAVFSRSSPMVDTRDPFFRKTLLVQPPASQSAIPFTNPGRGAAAGRAYRPKSSERVEPGSTSSGRTIGMKPGAVVENVR